MKNYNCSWPISFLCVVAAAAGCNLFPTSSTQGTKVGDQHQYVVSQFVFLSDREMAKNKPMFDELSALREQVFKDLHLSPSTTRIQIRLFNDRDSYERFMKTKYRELDLPSRKAFFVADPRAGSAPELMVYTYWSDSLLKDLRHELTHALLHSVLKGVPIWLDEGLAQYFETPAGARGVNLEHVRELETELSQGRRFDLARLEGLREIHKMNHEEYREAWAWVHFMMTDSPVTRQVLHHYLRDLRNNPEPGPLRPRLAEKVPSLDEALQRHVVGLDPQRGPIAANRP